MHIENIGGKPGPHPHSSYNGEALLNQSQDQSHGEEVKSATTPDHIRNFLEKNDAAHLLPEAKQSKATAYLQKHPKLTFLLGGAALILSGVAFAGAATAFLGAVAAVPVFAVCIGLAATVLAPAAPVLVLAGTMALIPGLFGSSLLAAGASMTGIVMGIDGIELTSSALEQSKKSQEKKWNKLEQKLEPYKLSDKEKTDVKDLLKKARFFNTVVGYRVEDKIEMAYRIKNSNLSLDEKESLLKKLTDDSKPLSKEEMESEFGRLNLQSKDINLVDRSSIIGEQLDIIAKE